VNAGSYCRRFLLAQLVALCLALATLPFAGRLLYREDALQKADGIYVLAGARINRWLEASDLVKEGWAPEITLGGGYPRESLENKLLKQGVSLGLEGETVRHALIQLGHPPDRVRVIGYTDNTGEEARLLSREAAARHWSRVIVVTSKLHTRRAGIAMRRAFAGSHVEVIMRASRYDDDDVARYWQKRRTLRTVAAEFPKLIAYWIGLGD
jgi:uncharacterized SAM-binding protein YcdF (DUF218 family)